MNAHQKLKAENEALQTLVDNLAASLDRFTDTSRDPERYAIEMRRDGETADVYRNTGRGWVWVADYDSRLQAERRVEEWLAEEEGE